VSGWTLANQSSGINVIPRCRGQDGALGESGVDDYPSFAAFLTRWKEGWTERLQSSGVVGGTQMWGGRGSRGGLRFGEGEERAAVDDGGALGERGRQWRPLPAGRR
jgi:hypothetical protein